MKKNKTVTVLASVAAAEILSEKQEAANDLFAQYRLWQEAEFNTKYFGGNPCSWRIEDEYERLLSKYVAMHEGSRLERDALSRCSLALYTEMTFRYWKLSFAYEYNGRLHKALWMCESSHGTTSVGDTFFIIFDESSPDVLIDAHKADPLEVVCFHLKEKISNTYRRINTWKKRF